MEAGSEDETDDRAELTADVLGDDDEEVEAEAEGVLDSGELEALVVGEAEDAGTALLTITGARYIDMVDEHDE